MWIWYLYIFTYLLIFIHLLLSTAPIVLQALQICMLLRMYLVLLFTSSVRFVLISSQQ